jgi:hypothetical protein
MPSDLTQADEDRTIRHLSEVLVERTRLGMLSDLELINEAHSDPDLEFNPFSLALMDRISPDWHNEIGEDKPQRLVSVPVPVEFVKVIVDYFKCRCVHEQHCLYCAGRAALYRATKDEPYAGSLETQ